MLKAIMFKFNVQIKIANKKISFWKISSTPQLRTYPPVGGGGGT